MTTSSRSESATASACRGWASPRLRTNLVPREIMNDRLVRAKKPWAVASVAALLLACTFNVFFYYSRLHKSRRSDRQCRCDVEARPFTQDGQRAITKSTGLKQEDSQLVAKLNTITAIGEELVGNADRQILWLEMLRTVNSTLPVTEGLRPGEIPDVNEVPFDKRQEIHVESLENQYFEDLSTWFTEEVIKKKYVQQIRDPAEQTNPDGTDKAITGPTGVGWVVEMKCYHFFNSDRQKEGIVHVLDTIVKRLKRGVVTFPGPGQQAPARQLDSSCGRTRSGAGDAGNGHRSRHSAQPGRRAGAVGGLSAAAAGRAGRHRRHRASWSQG